MSSDMEFRMQDVIEGGISENGRLLIDLDNAEKEIVRLRSGIQDALDCITEEINTSNYSHDTVCKIANETDHMLRTLMTLVPNAN